MHDYIVRAATKDGCIRIFSANTRDACNEARRAHNALPTPAAALGRALTAAAIMGGMLKGENDSITLQLKGNGPLKGVLAVSDSQCSVRGYVGEPGLDLPLSPKGKLDVGRAIGREGYLSVARDFGLKEPYVGRVSLVSGEVAEDLALYYARSEQVPTVVALGVLVDRDLSVRRAGGFVAQLMPGAPEGHIDMLERNVAAIPSVTDMLESGMTAEDMMHRVLDGFETEILDKLPVRYHCPCSRDRMERAIISLGKKEICALAAERDGAELVCHFCDKIYNFSQEDLEELLHNAL